MPTTRTFTTEGPCACCGAAPSGLECRTRGGFAMQCGFPGFVDMAKTYRTLTFSGGFVVNFRFGPDCTGAIEFVVGGTYSGTCLFNAETCERTDTGKLSISGGGACSDFDTDTCEFTTVSCGGVTVPPAGTVDNNVLSDTQLQQVPSATPCNDGIWELVSSDSLITLSDEDTATDAIARLIAASSWSSWADPAPGHCQASWEIPSFFPGFFYYEAQFRYTVTGLTPSTSYTLTLDVYESVYGMGSYSMVGTVTAGFTTDGSGNAVITGDVPITQGYDTYVTNPVVS